jgi:hypothetical protein
MIPQAVPRRKELTLIFWPLRTDAPGERRYYGKLAPAVQSKMELVLVPIRRYDPLRCRQKFTEW